MGAIERNHRHILDGPDEAESGQSAAGRDAYTAGDAAVDARLAYTVTEAGVGATPPMPDVLFQAGEVFGRYRIKECVGRGGMGVVYAALDSDLQRTVALKLLGHHGKEGTVTQARRRRLLREARAMARLDHPNVLTVYEVGTIDEHDFIAMAFADGGSLEQWLQAEARPWREVVRLVSAAARGLGAAHDAGLVHRDFKPANVLLGKDGRVMVTDFGLARMDTSHDQDHADAEMRPHAHAPDAVELTQTGALLGTPAYMAPEQHLGRAADARSDQYSLCVALYEGLFGTRPFTGDTLAALLADKRERRLSGPRPDTDVPHALREVVLRGLCPAPDERYASMDELIAALERACAEPPDERDAGHAPRPGTRRSGMRVLLWLLPAALVLALLLLHGITSHRDRETPGPVAPAAAAAPVAAVPVPEDPARRARVEELRARLSGIERLEHQGRYLEALAACEPVVVDARALGYAPVLAEALARRGRLHRYLARDGQAREDWQEAALLAEESAYERLYAHMAVGLAEIELTFSSDTAQQQAASRRAAAAAQRLADAPVENARVVLLRARQALLEKDHEQGEALAREALAVFERENDPVAVADAYEILSLVQGGRGDLEAALASALARRRVLVEEFGKDHVRPAEAIELVMLWYSSLGPSDEAQDAFQEGLRLWRAPGMRAFFEAKYGIQVGETRSVRGRVTQAGRPVAGARVVLGARLLGDGRYVAFAGSVAIVLQWSMHVQTTDENGRFAFSDVPAKARLLIAESDTGRSPEQLLDEQGEPAAVELELQPYSRLSGRVSSQYVKHWHRVRVGLAPTHLPRGKEYRLHVPIQPDGRFEFERLLPGEYSARVYINYGTEDMAIHRFRVDVPPGGRLDVVLGRTGEQALVDLTVVVRGGDNTFVPVAIVGVLDPGVHSATLREIRAALVRSSVFRQAATTVAARGVRQVEAALTELTPGPYSLCVLPLPGDYQSAELMRELGPQEEDMFIECRQITVQDQPDRQQVTFELVRPRARPE